MFLRLFLLLAALSLGACSNFAARMASNLATAIGKQSDPETVRDGVPAYLVLIDALILDDPNNQELLLTAAKLYGSYSSAFVDDATRAKQLSTTAYDYAQRALCLSNQHLCQSMHEDFAVFSQQVEQSDEEDLPALYGVAAAWLGWMQAHSDDWLAIADLPRIRLSMQRIVALDPEYQHGAPHIYLGVLESLLPPALGGKPDVSRQHFEQAIQLSAGKNLMAKVFYARYYARLVFDRELYESQLQDVLAVDPKATEDVLANTLAQTQAKALLADTDNYF